MKANLKRSKALRVNPHALLVVRGRKVRALVSPRCAVDSHFRNSRPEGQGDRDHTASASSSR